MNAYLKIKFLELVIIQVSTKKLGSMLSSQKSSNDKAGLGYISEGSSSNKPKKEVRFVLAKNVEKSKVEKLKIKILVVAKRTTGVKPKKKREVITQKLKGTLNEAFLSSL